VVERHAALAEQPLKQRDDGFGAEHGADVVVGHERIGLLGAHDAVVRTDVLGRSREPQLPLARHRHGAAELLHER